MQEINDSLYLVIQSQYFWWYMSTILSLGMVIGAKYDDRFAGFKKSLSLILPYTSIIFLTNISRMYERSQSQPLTATAYNSLWSLIIITLFYVLGLFIGHMIDRKAKQSAKELFNEPIELSKTDVMSENVKVIKSDVKDLLDK